MYTSHDLANVATPTPTQLGPTLHIESDQSSQSLHADALKDPDSPIHQ